MNTFYLKVLASDKEFFCGNAQELFFETADGSMCIQAYHENMLIELSTGEIIIIEENGNSISGFCTEGIVKILNNEVLLLSHTIEKPEEIDLKRAERALKRADEKLRHYNNRLSYYHSQSSLSRAIGRIDYAHKFGIYNK